MSTAELAQETSNFSQMNTRLHEFLDRYKQLNEFFGIEDPSSHESGRIGMHGYVQLVLNAPGDFRFKVYKGDGSKLRAVHRTGPRNGFDTGATYDQDHPFEAHQLQAKIDTDLDYNTTSSLRLTGHMSDGPSNERLRSIIIPGAEDIGDYVFCLGERTE